MNAGRLARNISTAAVASIAAWSSWSHMVDVALAYGERAQVAYVLAISGDGMLVVASPAMVDDRRAGRPVRWSARIAFVAGVGASMAANIAAAQPSLGARVVAAWPAVALLLVVEMLSRTRRARPDLSAAVPDASGAVGPDTVSANGAGPQRRSAAATGAAIAAVRAERPDATASDIAAAVGVSERHVRRLLGTPSRSLSPRPAPTTASPPEPAATTDRAANQPAEPIPAAEPASPVAR
ncbi:DUF2637 domain-containing protein [Micromonospora sp. CPCC 205371]|nr:DUF2637 domain-containing protein [Micromonospora sp. CPCC 205371]